MENNFNYPPQNPYKQPQPTGEVYSPVSISTLNLTEGQIELNYLKKKMSGIGIVLIITFALMQLWVFPFIIIGQLIGFSYESVYGLIQNEYFMNATHILSSSLCFTIPFIILAKSKKRTVSELVPLGRPKKGLALPFFFFGFSLCALSNIFSASADSLFDRILSLLGLRYDLSSETNERGLLIFILAFLSTAVIPALVEEFACRGIMLGLLKEHSEGAAIIITSVLFSIIHGNFVQIPFAFMVGLALAVIRVKTGTLWVAIAVHFCNNLVSVIFEYLLYPLSENVQNVIYYVYLMVCLLLGIVGVVLISKKSPDVFKLEFNKNGTSEKKLIKTALLRPTIIIIISIYLLLALSFIKA